MANPILSYGSKTVDLGKMNRQIQIHVSPPRTVNRTLAGSFEVVTVPRVDITVSAEWLIDSISLKAAIENWAQAALRGEAWSLAIDGSKTVNTTIAVDAAAGDTAIWVENPSGITAGQTYRIIDGPNYQLVDVSSVSADSVTLTEALDVAIGTGALFRDQFYFVGILRNEQSPITLLTAADKQDWPPTRFVFTPEFQEDVAQEISMLSKVLASNASGSDSSSAQDWFPTNGDVSVAANTTYEMEGYLRLSRSAGTTSHTTSILFSGTATLTSIAGKVHVNTGDAVANIAENGVSFEVATATVVKAASTSATEQTAIHVRGIVRVNTAGTFVPQFQFSAAPGGAPSVLANSFFLLRPLGSGSFTSIGTWS